jgi:MFS family permease
MAAPNPAGTPSGPTAATSTAGLYSQWVGPLLSRDDGADAEQLSQLTLAALGQASLRRHWPLVSGSLAGLGAELQRRDLRLEQSLFGCRFANPVGLAAGFDKNAATEITAGALICFMLAQPLMGWLSDIWGRKRMLIAAFGIGALMAWPVFVGIANAGSPWIAFAILFGALLVQSAYTSISAVIKAELFPTHVRALGVALPYALANAMFGGTAEYVALWFKSSGIESGFFIYVATLSVIGFLVAIFMRDTKLKSEILED